MSFRAQSNVLLGLFTDMIFISVWALTLSVQHDWAMREPQEVERSTDFSTLSFMLCTLGQVFGKVPSRYG